MEIESSVGANIRKLREERGYSLRALAELCGLSVNAISRIERGANSPTVKSLEQISSALGVSIVSLFSGEPKRLVVFRSQGYSQAIHKGGVMFENLIGENTNLPFQCIRITAQPGHELEIAEVTHPGHEFIYCLSGRIHFWISQALFTITAGDCLCLDARQPHYWCNPAQEQAVLMVVTYSGDGMQSYFKHHPEVSHFTS